MRQALRVLREHQTLSPLQKWDSPRRLAEYLGYQRADEQAKVYNWFESPNGPPWRDTILVLDLCGFLTSEGRRFLGLNGRPGSDEARVDRDRVEETSEAAASASERLRRRAPGERGRGTG